MPFQEVLSPELIIAAYKGGYFPMPDPESGEMLWFNPDPRAILPLDQFHVSKSLRRTQKKDLFRISFDYDFRAVIEGCAERKSTWISGEIKKSFIKLFDAGICHSVEVWNRSGALVGGLYGVSQGGVFNAESMFSRETDASKIALWALIVRMKDCGLQLLEVQFMTEHLRSLGAIEIPRDEYMRRLADGLQRKVKFLPPVGEFKLDASVITADRR